jgi:hypothetical protein
MAPKLVAVNVCQIAYSPFNKAALKKLPALKSKIPHLVCQRLWIERRQRDEAIARGYTVVEPAVVAITTHLDHLIHQHAAELLGRQETQDLLDHFKQAYPKIGRRRGSQNRLSGAAAADFAVVIRRKMCPSKICALFLKLPVSTLANLMTQWKSCRIFVMRYDAQLFKIP